jgi:hypothetical protein
MVSSCLIKIYFDFIAVLRCFCLLFYNSMSNKCPTKIRRSEKIDGFFIRYMLSTSISSYSDMSGSFMQAAASLQIGQHDRTRFLVPVQDIAHVRTVHPHKIARQVGAFCYADLAVL